METKMMYRVWYGASLEKQALFTEKADAARFAEVMNGCLNAFKWTVQIEE